MTRVSIDEDIVRNQPHRRSRLVDRNYRKSDNFRMARVEYTGPFDPDTFPSKVVGYAASLGDHDSGSHTHQRGQLLYARQGCIRITLADLLCLLPPSRAAWIPPGAAHRAVMQKVVDYRSIWFDQSLLSQLPQQVCVIEIGSVLEAILEPIALAAFDQDWTQTRFEHLVGLAIHEINEAPRQPMLLPMPQDKRLAKLVANPGALPPELNILAENVGATTKTIRRIFQRETGMSYQEWRQQWRVMRAVELLVNGAPLSHATGELGFSSDSAFIAFFKQMLGCTPGAYLRRGV